MDGQLREALDVRNALAVEVADSVARAARLFAAYELAEREVQRLVAAAAGQ